MLGFLGNSGHRYKRTNTNTRGLEKQKAVHWRTQGVMEKLLKEDKATLICCVTSGKSNSLSGLISSCGERSLD